MKKTKKKNRTTQVLILCEGKVSVQTGRILTCTDDRMLHQNSKQKGDTVPSSKHSHLWWQTAEEPRLRSYVSVFLMNEQKCTSKNPPGCKGQSVVTDQPIEKLNRVLRYNIFEVVPRANADMTKHCCVAEVRQHKAPSKCFNTDMFYSPSLFCCSYPPSSFLSRNRFLT